MINRQICLDDIQPIESLSFVPLENSYIKVLIARIILVYVIFMACALFFTWLADLPFGWAVLAIVVVLAVAMVANVFLARKIYNIIGYALRDKDISYRRGLFFTTVTTVPFSKIQQVSVRLNPISRIFGLYYVDVINGSQDAMNRISIPGLTREKAEQIKSLFNDKCC